MVATKLNNGFKVTSESDFGRTFEGTVGEMDTLSVIYEPTSEAKGNILLATGLLSKPASYDLVGKTALEKGYRTVIIGHDHKLHEWPLRANADEIIKAEKKLDLGNFSLVGHSMGTVTTLLAMEDKDFASKVDSVVQFNPPMFGFYTPIDVINFVSEFVRLGKEHPGFIFDAASVGVLEVIRRPLVIGKQIVRLGLGRVDERLQVLTARHSDKPITYIFNSHDGIVPSQGEWTLADMDVVVYRHDSAIDLGHFAICLDPSSTEGMISIIENGPLGPDFTKVSSRTSAVLQLAA